MFRGLKLVELKNVSYSTVRLQASNVQRLAAITGVHNEFQIIHTTQLYACSSDIPSLTGWLLNRPSSTNGASRSP